MTDERPGRPLAFFLATSGHSGVDRVMGNLIRALAERGVPVDLLRIRRHGPRLDPCPEGVRIVDLGTAHVNSALPAVVRYLRRERPRAVLSDKDRVNRTLLVAGRLSGGGSRIVVRVGTTVSVNLERRSRWHRRVQLWSMRRLYPWADAVVVPSEGAAEDLARVGGLPRGLIHVVPSPVVDDGLFERAAEEVDHPWFAPGNVPVVLGVGELCARKDFSTLVRAFARVRAQRRCRLVILGKGRQRERLLRMAEDLGVAGDVWLPGFVDNPYAFMAKAGVFALSSVCEGSPVVLMEALALGRPIVSTDCPSGPWEVLEGGRLGALVPVGDAGAMAGALAAALDGAPDAAGLSGAAGRYRVDASASRYLEVMRGEGGPEADRGAPGKGGRPVP